MGRAWLEANERSMKDVDEWVCVYRWEWEWASDLDSDSDSGKEEPDEKSRR